MCVVPVDVVIRRMSMLDDGLLVQFSSSAVRPVFLDPGGKVPAGFPDVDLAALTRDAVHSWATTGRLFVLVGVEEGL